MENKPLPLYYDMFFLWDKDPNKKHLRFGQWFIINFDRTTNNPELFYEQDAVKAIRMIAKQYYSLDISE